MLLSEYYYDFVIYISWIATAYLSLTILSKLWLLITEYIIPIFKEPQDLRTYGQWAVITGSTDGIGKGFALELARKGMDICLLSRNEEKLQDTAKEIESIGVKVKYIVTDFTDADIYDHIRDNLSELDIGILVNNIGIVNDKIKTFNKYNGQFVKETINANIVSATMMTAIVVPSMIVKKTGLIINMSSLTAEVITPYLAIYSSSKAYLSMFGACLSYQLKKYNIQVKTLSPGLVYTNMSTRDFQIDKIAKFLPSAVVTVQNFVNSVLLSLNSGNNKSCGHLAHEIYLMLIKTIPIDVIRYVLSLFYASGKKKK